MIEHLENFKTGNKDIDNLTSAAAELLSFIKFSDDAVAEIYPEDIAEIVKLHAKIATGAALIPVPGIDAVVAASAIWSMYGRINSKLGVSIKENVLKTLASGVITNLASYTVVLGIGSGLKLIPGIGTVVGTTIMLAGVYATTLLSGWIYIKVLTIIAKKNNGIISFDELSSTMSVFIKDNKEEIKSFFFNAKNFYKKNKDSFKLNEEEKDKLKENLKKYQQTN